MSKRPRWRRWLPGLLIAITAVAGGTATVGLIQQFLAKPVAEPKKVVQEIRLIRPPPPEELPPPPPPPETEEDVQVPDPSQPPDPGPMDDAPAADMLGVDAEGVAGGDGFGLMARSGGRDLLSGAGGSVYTWYAGKIKNEILNLLDEDARIRARRYSVNVRLWLGVDGTVKRVALDGSTGNGEIDMALRNALESLTRIPEPPPPDLPQPIQLRIVSRS